MNRRNFIKAIGACGVLIPVNASASQLKKIIQYYNSAATVGGPTSPATFYPTADSGIPLYTASTGSDLYAMVDEATADDDTTYIFRADSGGSQLMITEAPSIPAGATNIAVSVVITHRVDTGDSFVVRGRLVVGGTTYEGSNFTANSATYVESTRTWSTNPATSSAWTVDDINGVSANPLYARVGISMVAPDVGETWYITRLVMVITWD